MTSFALPGEHALVRIFRNNKSYSEADLVQILRPSPDRIDPFVPFFKKKKCGGCQYQHFRYESQLEWKTRQVKELLWHMARIESEVLPAIPSPKTYGYRSKLTPHFPKPKAGKPIAIGFLKQGTRSKYIEIEQCPLISEAMNQQLKTLRERTQRLHRDKVFQKRGYAPAQGTYGWHCHRPQRDHLRAGGQHYLFLSSRRILSEQPQHTRTVHQLRRPASEPRKYEPSNRRLLWQRPFQPDIRSLIRIRNRYRSFRAVCTVRVNKRFDQQYRKCHLRPRRCRLSI